jgi:hypothetical protein
MEYASCHPSGAKYFEVAPTFLKKLCTSALDKDKFLQAGTVKTCTIPNKIKDT